MKKIMTIIAAAAVALTLVGCANFGDAKASGTKWEKTFKLDATTEKKDSDGKVAKNVRGFVALSTSKYCSKIETTITLPLKDEKNIVVVADGDKAGNYTVVGLAFDVHVTKTADNKEFYDFVLLGVQPSTGKFYLEKYVNIAKDDLKADMNTNQGTIGNAAYAAKESAVEAGKASWISLDNKGNATFASSVIKTFDAATLQTDGYSWTVSVTQETAGTYVVKVGDKELGKYTRALTDAEKADTKHDGKAYGQVFMYGNAQAGTKIEAKFKSNKDATVGLFADEEEF